MIRENAFVIHDDGSFVKSIDCSQQQLTMTKSGLRHYPLRC